MHLRGAVKSSMCAERLKSFGKSIERKEKMKKRLDAIETSGKILTSCLSATSEASVAQ